MLLSEATTALSDPTTIFWMAVGTLITGMVGMATKLLAAWTDAQVAKIKNENLRGKVQLAKDEIGSVVYAISQTMVPEIRDAAADGKITPEERQKLLDAAVSMAKARFSAEFWTDLAGELELSQDELGRWLVDQVEARVFQMKMQRGDS